MIPANQITHTPATNLLTCNVPQSRVKRIQSLVPQEAQVLLISKQKRREGKERKRTSFLHSSHWVSLCPTNGPGNSILNCSCSTVSTYLGACSPMIKMGQLTFSHWQTAGITVKGLSSRNWKHNRAAQMNEQPWLRK